MSSEYLHGAARAGLAGGMVDPLEKVRHDGKQLAVARFVALVSSQRCEPFDALCHQAAVAELCSE